MTFEHRPERSRLFLLMFLGTSIIVAGLGCGSRGGPVVKTADPKAKEDQVGQALGRIERDPDTTTCREVLQFIDSGIPLNEPKPETTQADLQPLARLLALTPRESELLTQNTFAPIDGDYLADALLVRDGIRSLDLNDHPKLKQAELAFVWVCRSVYITNEFHLPAPASWVLEAGSGTGLDRACVFLDSLRQIGLEGCLIAPPELATTGVVVPVPGQNPQYAANKVVAVGVRIGGDIVLFDPWLGKPITVAGRTATLAQVRADASPFADWLKARALKAEDVKRWEVFLTAPLLALAPRMQWLERQIPKSNAVRLYVDLLAEMDRFNKETLAGDAVKGVKCRVWSPENEPFSPLRVLVEFGRETKREDGSLGYRIKDEFVESHLPKKFIPIIQGLGRASRPQQLIDGIFRSEFADLLLAFGSPRDKLLRGSFSNATAALDDLKKRNDIMRDRVAREAFPPEDAAKWVKESIETYAEIARAEQSGDTAALAKARSAEVAFRKSPLTEKMFFRIRKITSLLLSAEASYLLSITMHERAERAMARFELAPNENARREAEDLWKNASGSWQRYLDNYPELRTDFKDRDEHAAKLHERCREGLANTAKK